MDSHVGPRGLLCTEMQTIVSLCPQERSLPSIAQVLKWEKTERMHQPSKRKVTGYHKHQLLIETPSKVRSTLLLRTTCSSTCAQKTLPCGTAGYRTAWLQWVRFPPGNVKFSFARKITKLRLKQESRAVGRGKVVDK